MPVKTRQANGTRQKQAPSLTHQKQRALQNGRRSCQGSIGALYCHKKNAAAHLQGGEAGLADQRGAIGAREPLRSRRQRLHQLG